MQGDVLAAEHALATALDHWRGPALAEVHSLSAAQGAITRLDQLRLSALEELGEVRLALGKHDELVDVLLQAVHDFPLAERLTAQLMLALYRSGRQADALRAYSALAHRLDDELGTRPSAEVRQLEEDILLQRDRIDFVGPARPEPTGSRPVTTTKIVGRRTEMQRLLDVYDAAATGARRAALVSGTAGIGKTTLATAAAERAAQRGATVLTGSCAPDPDAPSPIAQILTSALPLVDSDTRAIACAELELLHASPSSDDAAGSGRRRTTRASSSACSTAWPARSSSLPTCPVLVVEDAQWADDSTLLVLRQLLRHPDVDRLLVVVTYREDEVDERRAKTITRLAPRECTEAVHLAGLNEHEIRSLVRAAMGPQVVPALLGVARRRCATPPTATPSTSGRCSTS